MGFHTYPVDRADALDDPDRFRYVSAEELFWLLDPAPGDVVVDVGSGTGFYTDAVAPDVARCYAVDVQPAMHARYREKGIPTNVEPITANADALPFGDGVLHGAFSTMTYHEFASPAALAELHRALAPDSRLAVADWSADGAGADGPPLTERYSLPDAIDSLEAAGFAVDRGDTRRETFVLSAVRE